MKKIYFILASLAFVLNAQAQILNRIKDQIVNKVAQPQAGKAAENNSQPAPSPQNRNFRYISAAQAATQYGTKINSIPTGYWFLPDHQGAQYWVENNQVKYYFTTAKITATESDFDDKKVYFSDGTSKSGDPTSLKLPLSNTDKTPPCIAGFGSFEEEISPKNYIYLSEKNPHFSVSTSTSNSLPVLGLTVDGKKMGDYKMAMLVGVYSFKTGKAFYVASSGEEVMPNAFYVDGKLTYKSPEMFMTATEPQSSANGTKAVISVMNMGSNGRLAYVFNDGKTLPPFEEDVHPALMNSGDLMFVLQEHHRGYNADQKKYWLNGKSYIGMPEKFSKDFFSDETAMHWASKGENTLYFSDGTAIQEGTSDENSRNNKIHAPKKVVINGKSHLVWFQQQGSDLYLCKKEL